MKKLLIASAISAMFGFSAQSNAFDTISFDINGSDPGGLLSVDVFDWLPGNALAVGSLGQQGEAGVPTSFTTLYQAKLNSFIYDDNGNQVTYSPAAGTEFTVVASIDETQIGVGTGTANFVITGGSFSMFYDTTADANDISGLGYSDGLGILSGSIISGTGTFTDDYRAGNEPLAVLGGLSLCDLGIQTAGCDLVLLDQNGADNQAGTLTHTGNGSSTVNVDVTMQDNDFFKSDLTSLVIGLNDTTNLVDPFAQANPSDLVVGVAPSYSNGVNGADCPTVQGINSQRCDFHFQSDGSTSFNRAVPEPATLALLGLGLLGLGMSRNRRKF